MPYHQASLCSLSLRWCRCKTTVTLLMMTRNSILAFFLAWQAQPVQHDPLVRADSVLDLGNIDEYDAKARDSPGYD